MIKSKWTIITLLSLAIILISCISSTNNTLNENKTTSDNTSRQLDKIDIDPEPVMESTTATQIQIPSKASDFVQSLKTGEKLSSFFMDHWLFVYHEDNRCEGSTDGQVDKLPKVGIDSIIKLQVKNDGDGWACDKKEPKTFDLDFDLKKKIADWDRFELANYENQEENTAYIFGAGESDYLKLHFNDDDMIIKLAYRSEDPG